jgi:hypothetical protein
VYVADDKKPRGMTPYVLETDRADAPVSVRLVHSGYRAEKRDIPLTADTKVSFPVAPHGRSAGRRER